MLSSPPGYEFFMFALLSNLEKASPPVKSFPFNSPVGGFVLGFVESSYGFSSFFFVRLIPPLFSEFLFRT